MNGESYKLEWRLGTLSVLEVRLTDLDQSRRPPINRWFLSFIPLEWIRETEYRFFFWEMAKNGLNKLNITQKDRNVIVAKLARVVAPVTEKEAKWVDLDPANKEFRDAFEEMIKRRDQLDAKRTPETEKLYNDAYDKGAWLWLLDWDIRKSRYEEETKDI